jgi:hypothetical protein
MPGQQSLKCHTAVPIVSGRRARQPLMAVVSALACTHWLRYMSSSNVSGGRTCEIT